MLNKRLIRRTDYTRLPGDLLYPEKLVIESITRAVNFIIELQSNQLIFEWLMFAFGQDMHIKAHSAEMLKPNHA